MKKCKLLFGIAFAATLVLTACGTTQNLQEESQKDQKIPQQEVAEIEETTLKEQEIKESEVEEPANVKFARQLQELLAQNDIKGAIALFDEIPAELSDDTEMKLLLGALYFSDGQYENSIAVANKVLELDPQNMDALELISMCQRAMGDKVSYKNTANQILQLDPYNATANIQKAEEYALNKKWKPARECYKKVLQKDSDNTEALFGYAQMSYYLDDVKTAKNTFQKILNIDSKNDLALAYMAKLYAEDSNYSKASEYVSQALKIDENNYDYWIDYGSYLRFQGKFDEAEKAWTRATEIDPDYFLAYAYLAGHFDENEKIPEALENYRKVIKTNPKYFYAYESTAILEYHEGNYKNSIAFFSKAYEYSQSYSYSLMIAACYYKLKDPLSAKKVLQAQLKKMDNSTVEYSLVRFFADNYSRNAENTLISKINTIDSSNTKGKFWFYLGLYYELNGAEKIALDYYTKVTNLHAPMFFEYRFAEWGLKI